MAQICLVPEVRQAYLAFQPKQWQRSNMTQVAFLHVPKTAGTTIHKLMEDNLGPIAFYPPRTSPELTEQFGKGYNDLINRVDGLQGTEQDQLLSAFRAVPAVGGHTTSAIIPYLSEDRFVFTSLRPPGDRLVSWYFHYVHPDDPKKMVRPYREETMGMSFDEFVQFKPMLSENDNVMIRYFARVPGHERVNESHLEAAKKTLETLDLILFQKSLDEGLQILGHRFGWNLPAELETLKRSKNRRKLGKDFSFSKQIMNRFIRFDRELVEFARTLPQAAFPPLEDATR